ncbi:hypothetical protein ACFOGJ_08755 [Marinibaculum pumilum]|uniref:Uncharacterized protein n=1 Tax=Marinibaculum pumilum TaxID=1766165 RepID=A0ABV7KYS6_9PROT
MIANRPLPEIPITELVAFLRSKPGNWRYLKAAQVIEDLLAENKRLREQAIPQGDGGAAGTSSSRPRTAASRP